LAASFLEPQMAEPAIKRMTVDEFFGWDDGTDTRYELIDGHVVAMAPPARAHSQLVAALAAEIRPALRARQGCTAQVEAGIVRPDRADLCFVADLAVTCEPAKPDDRFVDSPVLVVEVLSPSTNAFDRNLKVPEYRQIPSVQEILLIDSESCFAEILRRDGKRWITEIVQGSEATLSLSSVPLTVAMSELYEGIPLPQRPGRTATA
jgi:Uma2 family endonuclease